MENEPEKERGKLFIGESEQIPKGSFLVSYKKGEKFIPIIYGKLEDLCDSLFGSAIVREKQLEGIDIYYILNHDDAKKFDEQGE